MTFGMTNGRVQVEVDGTTGAVVGLRHGPLGIDLVRVPDLADSFRLLVPLPHRRGHYIRGSEQRHASVSIDHHVAEIVWTGLTSDEGVFDIEVVQTIELDDDNVVVRIHLENRSPFAIEEAWTLALGGIANPDERLDWRIHYADWAGKGREWPFFDEFPGTYLGPPVPVWVGPYHGELSLPWIDLYHVATGRGVYIGNHDDVARKSAVVLELRPSTVYGAGGQLWPTARVATDTAVGATIGWAQFPFLAPGDAWQSPPVVVHFHETGGWWAAADFFRGWFDRHTVLDKTGHWLVEEDAWQSTIMSYPDGTIGYRFCDIPEMARQALGAGIRVLQLDGWDIGGIDRDYPHYQPDPRLGTRQELVDAIQTCEAMGVRILLFSNLQWVSLDTDWYEGELARYVVRDPRGHVRAGIGWEYNTTLGLMEQTIHRMVPANPSHPGFRHAILDELEGIVGLGAAGTQIDKLGAMSELDLGPAAPIEPAASLMRGTLDTLEAFRQRALAIQPTFGIASEVHWDRAVPFVDAAYGRFFSIDHLPTFGHTFPEYRQSCAITGDFDFGLVNNCLRFGHIINLEARCLHGTAADTPRLASYIAEALRTRRRLWDAIWHSTVVERTSPMIRASADVLVTMHRGWDGETESLVLNHFKEEAIEATIDWTGPPGELTIHRPFRNSEPLAMRATVTIPPDEFCIVVRRSRPTAEARQTQP